MTLGRVMDDGRDRLNSTKKMDELTYRKLGLSGVNARTGNGEVGNGELHGNKEGLIRTNI